ncbi:MAG: hypothetical protein KDF60_02970 [Calditrichaeota bacterium]|nr:hypothetical protein [Calditrichota bacterium]
MWILFKAEYKYYRVSTIFYALIFSILLLAFIFWGSDRVSDSYPALRSVMILILFAMLISRQIRINQEKTDCFYSRLPLSMNKIALLRFFYLSSFWIIMTSLFIAVYSISINTEIDFAIIRDLLSLTGIIFGAIAIPLIHRDLNIRYDSRNQKFIVGVVYLFIVALGYIFFMLFFLISNSGKAFEILQPYEVLVAQFTSRIPGAIAIFLVGLALLGLSSLIFQKRNKYLD